MTYSKEIQEFVRRGTTAQAAVDAVIAKAVKEGRATLACAKCGRVFTSPNEWRYNARKQPICRRFCKEAPRAR